MGKIRKLQGRVIDIERTGKFITDEAGLRWERCIFTIELTGFSRRTPDEVIPEGIKGKKVKLVRYCRFNWHYKLGVRKTLEPHETEAVLSGKPIETVFW
ncbi:hypothetical protein J7L00_03250 [Candidatus Bathyarchaeota archaeon]|nr:hypothetical protein [Candidatus Bathyarchaeota archaeon]